MTAPTPTPPLPDLADIHLPEPVSGFPWAPGWWLLLCLGVAAIAALAVWLYRRHRRGQYRRDAIAELRAMAPDLSDQRFASDINQLLRRAALCATGQAAAPLTGEHWRTYLCRLGGRSGHIDTSLFNQWQAAAYGAKVDLDRDALRQFAARWLRDHRPSAVDIATVTKVETGAQETGEANHA